jgi:hypothetical protein
VEEVIDMAYKKAYANMGGGRCIEIRMRTKKMRVPRGCVIEVITRIKYNVRPHKFLRTNNSAEYRCQCGEVADY